MSSSAALGSERPDGWLWYSTTAAALCVQRGLHHFARVERGARDRSPKEILDCDEPMAAIE